MSLILINEIYQPIKKAKILVDSVWRSIYESRILINEEWHYFELCDGRIRFHDFWKESIWSHDDDWGLVPVDFWDNADWVGANWSNLFRDILAATNDSLTGDDIWDASFEKRREETRKVYIPIEPIDDWQDNDVWKDNDNWKV